MAVGYKVLSSYNLVLILYIYLILGGLTLKYTQLLLKSLNTPADLLGQLRQSIFLILRLYACSSSTNLIACKCAKNLEDAGLNF